MNYESDIANVTARINDKVERNSNGCLIWTGHTDDKGRGRINFRARMWRVHRLVWTIYNGEIPHGMVVLLRCKNRLCVDRRHMFLGTNMDSKRGVGNVR